MRYFSWKRLLIKSIPGVIILCSLSCIQIKEKSIPPSFNPKVVEAKGHVVPVDSMTELKVILVDESKLKKIPVRKPEVVLIHSIMHLAGTPTVVIADTPRVSTSGQDTFLLPKKVLAIDSPFLAGIPEVVLAKDATTREPNPQNLTSYGPLQGLKQSNVSCLFEDNLGNLWIGINNEGVSKYDGKYFTHYTTQEGLSNNWVVCMMQDKSGNLWFGTAGGGVNKYDGKYFTHFTEKEGLSNNYISGIVEDKSGNLWFGTGGGGLNKYDGEYFTHFAEKEGFYYTNISFMMEDNSGNLWCGGFGFACKYDGKSFTHFTEKEGLSYSNISCILEDKSGNIWFSGRGFGVCKYDGKTFKQFTMKEGLSSDDVTSMLEDKAGNLWFSTGNSGVNKYDGKFFTYLTSKEGLSQNCVWNMLEDNSGNLWFGTAFGGVNKYEGKSFRHLTENEGLNSNEVLSILKDKTGNLWFGTGAGGVCRYDSKSIAHYTEKEGMSNANVMTILEDKSGNLWFGTWGDGLIKFDGKYFTYITDTEGLSFESSVSILVEDRSGNIWFGTEGNGVMKYDGKSLTQFTTKEGGLSGGIVRSILEDKLGNMWFGTWGDGVTKYDGKNFIHFTQKEGLSSNVIRSLLEDKYGNLWLGTYGGGLIRFDGEYFTNFTEKEGLSNNSIVSSLEDKSGNLWFGTRVGLSKVSKDKLHDYEMKSGAIEAGSSFFETYTVEDGFLGIGCRANSLCKDSGGTIWIGTNDRLTAYNPPLEVETNRSKAPNIQITGIQLFNENLPWVNLEEKKDSTFSLANGVKVGHFKFDSIIHWYGLPENLSLAYNNNNITFKYIGITMHRPKSVRYQYQLEGIDENWNAITDRTEASYGNLSYGSYTFKVKAMSSEGYWSNEYHYPFIIRPPWWFTWWAYSLYFLSIISLIYAVLRFQKQRTIKTEREKAYQKQSILNERLRISRDLHDEVGATLSGIVMYSHLAKSQAEQGIKEVENSINIVQESASEMVNKLNDVVWLVSPLQDKLENLVERLEEYAQHATSAKSINFRLNTSGDLDRILPIDLRKNIYLFCKEAINNAVKYSQGTMIEMNVTQTDQLLEFRIKDNGIGFDAEKVRRGNGLNNMQQRADDINADFRLQQDPGSGTIVSLKCKITQLRYDKTT